MPKCTKSRALNALKGKGLFFKETYACLEAKKAIRPTSHSAFQETACTTVYKRDGNSDAFLGDTKCKGIPVEVSLKTVLVAYSQEYRSKSVCPEGARQILLSGFFR